MKVLLVGNWYGSVGGTETHIHDVARGLESAGHPVVTVSDGPGADHARRRDGGHYEIPGLAYRGIRGVGSGLAARRRLRAMIPRERPDVAYVHNVLEPAAADELLESLPTVFFHHTHDLYCPSGSKLLAKSGRICPYPAGAICLLEAYVEQCHSRRPWKLIESFVRMRRARDWARRADGVVVDSRDMRERLIAEGFSPDRTWLVPPPVRIPDRLASPRAATRPPTVLFAGRLTPHKGLRYLLEAMTVGRSPYRLVVAGDGSSARQLGALARRLDLGGRVEFSGLASPERMDRLYDDCDLVVMPSVWPEPFGLVGPEAMAHGKPVVAFDVGGIPDWLDHGRTGFLVPPRDVRTLAERIDALCSDPALARVMGAAGRAAVVRLYGIDTIIPRLCAVLERVIHERRRASAHGALRLESA